MGVECFGGGIGNLYRLYRGLCNYFGGNMKDWDKHWTKEAEEQLLGKKIVKVRYMSQEECEDLGWTYRPVVMHLDDGNLIYASCDDEGNDGGALFTNNQANPVLPVMR